MKAMATGMQNFAISENPQISTSEGLWYIGKSLVLNRTTNAMVLCVNKSHANQVFWSLDNKNLDLQGTMLNIFVISYDIHLYVDHCICLEQSYHPSAQHFRKFHSQASLVYANTQYLKHILFQTFARHLKCPKIYFWQDSCTFSQSCCRGNGFKVILCSMN